VATVVMAAMAATAQTAALAAMAVLATHLIPAAKAINPVTILVHLKAKLALARKLTRTRLRRLQPA
jgi:Na+/serine symporter